jgi:hypothetical protein
MWVVGPGRRQDWRRVTVNTISIGNPAHHMAKIWIVGVKIYSWIMKSDTGGYDPGEIFSFSARNFLVVVSLPEEGYYHNQSQEKEGPHYYASFLAPGQG